MNNINKLFCSGALFLLLHTSLVCADDKESEKKTSVDCSADSFVTKDGYVTNLTNLKKLNIEFASQICKQLLYVNDDAKNENMNLILKDTYDSNSEVISSYFVDEKKKHKNIKKYFIEAFNVAQPLPFESKAKGLLSIDKVVGDDSIDMLFTTIDQRISFSYDDPACQSIDGVSYTNCKDAIDNISIAFNIYRSPYKEDILKDNQELLDTMSSDWKRFIDEARNQTIVDVWFNTLLNPWHYEKDHLVSPSKFQLFLAHPAVVYEHIKDAPKGEQDKAALAMEWLGVNWWDLPVPIGVSWVTVYSDRSTATSVDQGIMIYIDNKYAIGWVDADEGDGIFVSVDILKMVSNKNDQFKKYNKFF